MYERFRRWLLHKYLNVKSSCLAELLWWIIAHTPPFPPGEDNE